MRVRRRSEGYWRRRLAKKESLNLIRPCPPGTRLLAMPLSDALNLTIFYSVITYNLCSWAVVSLCVWPRGYRSVIDCTDPDASISKQKILISGVWLLYNLSSWKTDVNVSMVRTGYPVIRKKTLGKKTYFLLASWKSQKKRARSVSVNQWCGSVSVPKRHGFEILVVIYLSFLTGNGSNKDWSG